MNRNQMSLVEENIASYDIFAQLLGESQHIGIPNFEFNEIQSQENEAFHSASSTNTNIEVKKFTKKPKTHCTCQKSKCNMKYCPCYKQGKKCNSECICTDCCNQKFIPKKVTYKLGSLEQFSLPSFTF